MTPDPFGPGAGFGALFVVVPVLVLAGFVVVIVLLVKNYRRGRAHGLDPLTLETDLAARLMSSQLLAPQEAPVPLRERLAELERLRADGVITAEEYARARAAALGG